ncbi:MAG: aspartate/glutamate racemase family protein [Phycisphaerales bacterium]|nr:MAG: aspartate/glutamate racemase family protein [Phycisphaerales bacterium]
MKTIGLIGGMSWESSLEYYRIINEDVRERLGGLHSAKILMYSFDFAEIENLQRQGKWEKAAQLVVDAARRLEMAGADFLMLCTNTMHKVADTVEKSVEIPLLHIADAVAQAIKARNFKKVGLLGTRFTMEEDFYTNRLLSKHGVAVIVPDLEDRRIVNDTIYNELCLGMIGRASKETLGAIIQALGAKGAEGVILGCTELGLLIKQQDCEVPLFDSTSIHAKTAVDFALGE